MDISTAIESEALKKSYQGASELALPLVSHICVGCTPSAALIRRSGVGVSKFDRIINISFAIRQFQMNPTKPSFDMTMLYSYRDECTLNTNQLQCRFVIKIQPKILTASHQRTETVCPPLVAPHHLPYPCVILRCMCSSSVGHTGREDVDNEQKQCLGLFRVGGLISEFPIL